MRYHFTKPQLYFNTYGKTYSCNHPVYSTCTLFLIGSRGLAVIQQRYEQATKHTYWNELDPWLPDQLYLHPSFYNYFNNLAREPTDDGLYPTVTVRQMMWALKMKPLKRQPWETTFDKKGF